MGSIVSGIGNLLGGGNNSGFQAQAAGIQNPFQTTQGQAAAGQVASGYGQQQNLVNALQAQNGIGNQSSVFGQQQQLANALTAQSQGQGPNPAQAQLAQNTAANTANQASLAAGQRGASQNVGLIARQAAQTGAQNQQASVGQAATLQAQQQLAAQQQLQTQQQNLANLATTQVGQQTGAVGNLNNLALANQSQVLGAYQGINQANVANASQQNSANASMANTNANNSAGAIGGLLNGAGAVAGGALGVGSLGGLGSMLGGSSSSGGSALDSENPYTTNDSFGQYAKGGTVENPKLATVPEKDRYPGHLYPEHLKAVAMMYHPHKFANGGEVSQQQQPQSNPNQPTQTNIRTLPKDTPSAPIMKDGQQIGEAPLPKNFESGGQIPGKAKVKGDSYSNDEVPIMASPKEIVLPRSITMAEDAPEKAAEFVAKELQKHYKPEHNDFKEALKKAIASRKDKK